MCAELERSRVHIQGESRVPAVLHVVDASWEAGGHEVAPQPWEEVPGRKEGVGEEGGSCRAGQGRRVWGRAGTGRDEQGRAGQGRAGQHRDGQSRAPLPPLV